jgi:glucosamine--fructose-6-phosphate aminotransferase (isomerizing)
VTAIAIINKDGSVIDFEGTSPAVVQRITWDPIMAKGRLKHFMLKEPMSSARFATPSSRISLDSGQCSSMKWPISPEADLSVSLIKIAACGTLARGTHGQYMIEQLARIPVDVDYASGAPSQSGN